MHIARAVFVVATIAACGLAVAGDVEIRPSAAPCNTAEASTTDCSAASSDDESHNHASSSTRSDSPAPDSAAAGTAEVGPAPAAPSTPVSGEYTLQPGDLLTVSVWKEADLSGEVLVRPDGALSFPLVGDVVATGKTVTALRQEITERLKPYIPNPVVTVAAKTIGGNHIYVLGKVQRPGEYPFGSPVDVMQALSLAGGTNPYADVNHIHILRREGGKQIALRFHYRDVEQGHALEQNISLRSGDTVVVP